MSEITAASVAKLREMTGAGLMDCKKALTEARGDLGAAGDLLRKKGAATAVSKATREAREGVIAQYIAPGGRLGVTAVTVSVSPASGAVESFARTFTAAALLPAAAVTASGFAVGGCEQVPGTAEDAVGRQVFFG